MNHSVFTSKFPPVDLQKYKDQSYGGFLKECLTNNHDSLIVDTTLNVTITYQRLDELSEKFANVYRHVGALPHDVIHIYADNSILWAAACIGAQYHGLVTSASHTTSPASDLNRNLTKTGSTILITTAEKWNYVKDKITSDNLSCIITCDELVVDNNIYDIHIEETFLKDISHTNDEELHDVCYMAMTSGSTGTPKVIAFQSQYFTNLIVLFTHPTIMAVPKGETVNVMQPFPHIGGFTLNVAPFLYAGANLIMIKKFDETFINTIIKYRIQHIFAVAATFTYLSTLKSVNQADLTFVKTIWTSGTMQGAEVFKNVSQKFGPHVNVINMYGLSEAVPLFVSSTKLGTKLSNVGYLCPNGSFKLVRPENPDVFANPGEICVKGLPTFKCYYKDEVKTKLTFTKDGFLRTGDYGRLDEHGELELLSRTKEVIKYRGYMVFPSELENYLNSHPSVLISAVIGKPDEVSGELPFAFVVLKEEVSIEALKEYVKCEVPEYKQLHHIKIIKEMPLNDNKKIDKIFLKSTLSA